MLKRSKRKNGWKQWTPAQARGELKAWDKSGLTLERFARERGVGAQRLRWWHKRLGGVAEVSAAAKPVEPVHFVPALITSSAPALAGAVFTARFPGGVTLEVADVALVPPEWLGALVKAARGAER
jgi:hypothetical protein